MAIKIDTSAVRQTAQEIASINTRIDSNYVIAENAMNTLKRYWSGNAADHAMTSFRKIRETYKDARYGVINNMVSFINLQVGENYEETETVISSAAAAFK